mgnify:FL=1|jgi:hypothetical protein|tara:strand:+ start:600 stop:1067 length:468 start_codon:yes stop_codon:yes gene_type:complete
MPSNNVKLLEVIYKTPILKERIDESLESGSKINAIKELRGWCETSDNPNWLTDGTRVSLRLMKNVIDRYAVRRIIRNKLTKLSEQIENYCNVFGYDKMGSRRGAKSKDGLYVHKYTDYELVEDHIGFIVNNVQWSPSHKDYKQYNKLWKKYNAFK